MSRSQATLLASLALSIVAFARTVHAAPSAREEATRPLPPHEVARELERVFTACLEGDGHVSIRSEHRRTHIRITGARGRCPGFYAFLPEPPLGARILYELEIGGGVAHLRSVRTENSGGSVPPM